MKDQFNIRFCSTYDGLATYSAHRPDRRYPITICHRYNAAEIAPDNAPLNTAYVYNGKADQLMAVFPSLIAFFDAQWADAQRKATIYHFDLPPRGANPTPIFWDGAGWQPVAASAE